METKSSYYHDNEAYVESLLGGIPDGFDTRTAMRVLQDANADMDSINTALDKLQQSYYFTPSLLAATGYGRGGATQKVFSAMLRTFLTCPLYVYKVTAKIVMKSRIS